MWYSRASKTAAVCFVPQHDVAAALLEGLRTDLVSHLEQVEALGVKSGKIKGGWQGSKAQA
jgi:hypothetical protein